MLVSSGGGGGGSPEVAPRVHRSVVEADFVVQVRSRRTAAGAFVSDDVAAFYVRAWLGVERGKMPVPGGHAKAMVNDNEAPVAGAAIHNHDNAVGGGVYLIAVVRGDVNSRVERTFTAERVKALAEMTGNLADDRPQRRHDPEAAQLRGRQEPKPVAGKRDGG